MDKVGDLTDHFSWEDFQGDTYAVLPPPVRLHIPRTAQMLEELTLRLKRFYGKHEIVIKCSVSEDCCVVTRHEAHAQGKAVDIICPPIRFSDVLDVVRELAHEGIVKEAAIRHGIVHLSSA